MHKLVFNKTIQGGPSYKTEISNAMEGFHYAYKRYLDMMDSNGLDEMVISEDTSCTRLAAHEAAVYFYRIAFNIPIDKNSIPSLLIPTSNQTTDLNIIRAQAISLVSLHMSQVMNLSQEEQKTLKESIEISLPTDF